jgi:hypothetical protein
MPPFRYLPQEEQAALAVQALHRALSSFRSRQATLKTKKLLDEVIPAYAQTPLDRAQFVATLEMMRGQVVVDELGRRWRLMWLSKDSHGRTVVILRRVDGVEERG